jgi:hypothetical protein
MSHVKKSLSQSKECFRTDFGNHRHYARINKIQGREQYAFCTAVQENAVQQRRRTSAHIHNMLWTIKSRFKHGKDIGKHQWTRRVESPSACRRFHSNPTITRTKHKRIGAFLRVGDHAFDRKVDWNLIAYARPSIFPSASSPAQVARHQRHQRSRLPLGNRSRLCRVR